MKNKTPQRKPNKHLSGIEMLTKIATGSHKPKTEKELREEDMNKLINGTRNNTTK
jgi:hypothetical protein